VALVVDMTLQRGATGSEVMAWQKFLQLQGSTVELDGVFGAQTEDATKAWQSKRGLKADGIVGPASLAAALPGPVRAAPSSATSSGRLSARGRDLIKAFEGFTLAAYVDGKNPDGSLRYSIGYGHNGASKGQLISKTEADRLFDGDVSRFELCVAKACPVALVHQFDAMTSLAYNIGEDAFSRSTVARRHVAGDVLGAADAFLMWNQANDVVSKVLEARREAERDVYLHGYPGTSSAPSSAGGSGGLMAGALLALAGLGFVLLRAK
jgi:lysozyme